MESAFGGWSLENISANWKKLREIQAPVDEEQPEKNKKRKLDEKSLQKLREKRSKKKRKNADDKSNEIKDDSSDRNNANIPPMTTNNEDELRVTKYVALDCEMVGVEADKSMLARVVIANSFGNTIYDKYVQPQEKVLDYRTHVSGIQRQHLRDHIAYPFKEVQKEVADIIKDRVVVGHALENDFRALLLSHSFRLTRDTAKYRPLQRSKGKPRKLRFLAQKYLGIQIQTGEHDPAEDAKAALMLYKHFKKDWEGSVKKKLVKKSAKSKPS